MGYSDYNNGSCSIPNDGTVSGGQIYAFITNSKNLTDASVLAGKPPCNPAAQVSLLIVIVPLGPAAFDLDTANNTGSGSGGSGGGGSSGNGSSGGASNTGSGSASRPVGAVFVGLAVGALALVL